MGPWELVSGAAAVGTFVYFVGWGPKPDPSRVVPKLGEYRILTAGDRVFRVDAESGSLEERKLNSCGGVKGLRWEACGEISMSGEVVPSLNRGQYVFVVSHTNPVAKGMEIIRTERKSGATWRGSLTKCKPVVMKPFGKTPSVSLAVPEPIAVKGS